MSSSARMLRLLSLLQTHRHWSGNELASRLEVSERTVRRDVDRLRDLGYPVDATRGTEGGYQLQAGATMPPLLLDDEEAVAMAVALRTGAGATSGLEETSVRALSKLVQVMPSRLRRRVDAVQDFTVPVVWSGPQVDAGMLSTVAAACRDDERVRFSYARADGEASDRHVEPHRLVNLRRRWYLVGWDVEREDWRSFRLDRMEGARVTGQRFRQRELPAEDAAAYVQQGISALWSQIEVEVLVDAPADGVRQGFGRYADVEPVADDRCRVRMKTDDLAWPTMLLASIGATFEVVAPPELRVHLASVAAVFDRSTA